MRLSKWKEMLSIDLDKIRHWSDADIALAYYLKEAEDMIKRGRVDRSKKPCMVWWNDQMTLKKTSVIYKAWKQEMKKKRGK